MRLRRRLVAVLTATGAVIAIAALALVVAPTRAEATTASAASILKSFDPGDIISDAVMYNASTMSAAGIQSFLNAEQPTCASGDTCLKNYRTSTQTMAANYMCGTYTGASSESAATIISKVAHACRINPQVLLVLLQKEQTLITGRAPYAGTSETVASIYGKATGLGCPDYAPCDPAKYGFFNQVYGAGYWLIRYTTPPGTTGPGWDDFDYFPVGKRSAILYNPDTGCGSETVTVKNKATESLYVYTPYVPNAAALAAGYGWGDSCSAYGNRNFFLYFTDWFGSTHYAVTGAINTYWTAHGGATGPLGTETANAVTSTANGGGTYQTFQHGTVYSSPAGTFAITGALLSEYHRRGAVTGPLGWPAGSATSRSVGGITGTVQQFQQADLYTSSAGTAAVTAPVRAAFTASSDPFDPLGWPQADATTSSANGGGTVQVFTGGRLYVPTGKPAVSVTGPILATYLARGETGGSLGWPLSEPGMQSAYGTAETVQSFQGGAAYQAGTLVTTVTGGLYQQYAALRGPTGTLGWVTGPARHTSVSGGGWSQTFRGGTLFYSSTTGHAYSVSGPVLALYLNRGAAAGSLGWPTGQPGTVSAHATARTVQPFQGGAAYLTGTHADTVTGALYTAYAADGGPRGPLGWVIAPARRTTVAGGGWTQAFSGGTDYYSSRTRAAFPVTGAMLRHYIARGSTGGSFGWPVSAAARVSAHGTTRTVQTFEHGSFTLTGSTLTTVNGGLYRAYAAAGGPTGPVGWVTGSARHTSVSGGGWTQTFTGAVIYYSSRTHRAYPVTGPILRLYRARHEAASSLGWPTGDPTTSGAVTTQRFQHGTITSANGTAVLR